MYRGLLSKGERRFAWVMVALALVGIACGFELFLTHQNGGDCFWLGLGLVGFNTFQLGRIAFVLWEDRHG